MCRCISAESCCNVREDQKPVRELKETRGCTDVLFLILYLGFWAFTLWLLVLANKNNGDPQRIVRGVDMYGRICGKSEGVLDQPYAAWPFPSEYKPKVCVASCSETETDTARFALRRASTKLVYYCIPFSIGNSTISFDNSDYDSAGESLQRKIGDLYIAYPLILCSAGIALVVSFLYTWLLRGCAGFFIWGLLALGIILMALLSYVCFRFGVDSVELTDDNYDDKVRAYRIAGGVLAGIDFIALCIIIFLRDRIRLAIAVVKDSGRVLQEMPALAIFPVWPVIIGGCYLAYWLYVMLTLYSVGTMENQPTPDVVTHDFYTGLPNSNPTTMVVRKWDSRTRYYAIAHFFGLLWQVQFLIYMSYMIMAGSVANWYFTPSDALGNKPRGILRGTLPNWPICASIKRTLRYHVGTLAFGSLIIATIQFARAVLLYIQKTTSKRTNCMTRCLLSCAQCCLKCMQTFIDKVSKNAFVWTSIYATGFCQSSCLSFALIWRNLARTAALNVVSGVLVFFGKVLIVIVTTAICAAALIAYDPFDQPISSPLLPLIFIAIISYLVSSLFMTVFETTIDTMFLCFLIDYDSNGPDNLMAPDNMKALIEKHADESAKVAAEKQELRRQATVGGRGSASLSASGGHDGYGSSEGQPRSGAPAAAAPTPSAPTQRVSIAYATPVAGGNGNNGMQSPSAPDEPVFIPI